MIPWVILLWMHIFSALYDPWGLCMAVGQDLGQDLAEDLGQDLGVDQRVLKEKFRMYNVP